jgi:hypothetical protein
MAYPEKLARYRWKQMTIDGNTGYVHVGSRMFSEKMKYIPCSQQKGATFRKQNNLQRVNI